MVLLKMGKRRVVPFLNRDKAVSFVHKTKNKGYSGVGLGKRQGIYWVIIGNKRKKRM